MTLSPYSLQVEHRPSPLGLDEPWPRLGWKLTSDRNGDAQTAWRAVVERLGPRGESLGTAWDSGWCDGADQLVTYAGEALSPFTRYAWRVSLRDVDGSEGAGAESWFETGFLGRVPWTAHWARRDPRAVPPMDPPSGTPRSWTTMMLTPPRQFRRSFSLPATPVRARVYVSARGIYRLTVNGRRAGRDELTPGWTDYRHRVQYQVYDVTEAVRAGENVIGAVVGDGWWSGFVGFDARHHAQHYGTEPELIAELRVELDDGSTVHVTTDDQWRERPGEIEFADLLMGEAQDLRRRRPGWDTPGFDASDWPLAKLGELGGPELVGTMDEPVRVTDELPALSVTGDGDAWLVDFGQNLVGRARLSLEGVPAGTVLRLRHGEILEEGHLYTANLRTAEATDWVVADGEGTPFEPMFTTHGFRYIEVTGWPGELEATRLTAVVLHSDTTMVGELHASAPMVEQLISNIRWGQRGNFVSVPTDCPQRDERLGWTADCQVFLPTATYNADVAAFMSRWMLDVVDGQDADGAFPDVAPLLVMDREGAPAWGDGGVVVPHHLWRTYGDLRVLGRCFPAMKAWVDHIERHNPSLLWEHATGNNYGDWLQVDADTPREVVATAYFARSAELVAESARALGEEADASRYAGLAARVREAFAEAFVSADGRVGPGTQTAQLLGLAWDLVPEDRRQAAFALLCADIEGRKVRLTTGFVGVSLLCPVLTEWGRPDLAFGLLHQEEYPSWGYSVRHGATTIWERWDGWTEERGFQSVGMNSFNHYSLGSVGAWLWRYVAGIDQAPGSVGFADIVLRPHIGPAMDWFSGRFDSPRGLIALRWERRGRDIGIEVEVPPGRPARMRLDAGTVEVREATGEVAPTAQQSPVRVVGHGERHLLLDVEPGHHFLTWAPA